MPFLCNNISFSFYEKPLYISVRIVFSKNKNGVKKMTYSIEKKYGKKILNEDVEKQKRKLALLVGYYR